MINRSVKRRSIKKSAKKSPKRSQKKRSQKKRSNSLLGGGKQNNTCSRCGGYLPFYVDGVINKNGIQENGKWIHKTGFKHLKEECDGLKLIKDKTIENERASKKALIIASRRDKVIKNAIKKAEEKLEAEVELEIRASELKDKKKNSKDENEDSDDENEDSEDENEDSEDDWYFFKYPKPMNSIQDEMIKKEKMYRNLYKVHAKKESNIRISSIYKIYQDDQPTLVFYSSDSINRQNVHYPTPYSIEIHCTTFRPPNIQSDKFYGHVSLRIYRKNPENPEIYHYGVFVPENNVITDFTRKFWSNTGFDPHKVPLNRVPSLNILFPNKSAGTLMKDYYKWCIKFCPNSKPKKAPRKKGTYALLTEWGI